MPAGSVLRYYDNADWALNAKLRYSDGTGIDFSEKMKPIRFSYDLGATAAVNPSYLMDELYRTTDLSGSAGFSLNYTPTEKLRLSLSAGAAYTRSSSSISDAVIQALNWNYGTTLRYTPWNFAFLEARYNNSSRLILGSDNVWGNDFLKVSLGGSLLDGKLSIMLEGIDLLNNKDMYTTSYTENSFTQSFKPVFGQYVLLTLRYRFNSTQGKSFRSTISSGSEQLRAF